MSACRICQRPTPRAFDLHSSRHGIDVPVYRCADCKTYWSNGGPVNYDDVDLTGYYLKHAQSIRARLKRTFERLEAIKPLGRFLDIGAGMGFAVELAQSRGWHARGLEPNRFLATHARERGVDVTNAYLGADTKGTFDVVLIDNVLEHIAQPLPFLRDAVRLMEPDALLVVAVPPLDWLRDALGRSAFVRDRVTRPQLNAFNEADEHVNVFSRRAVARLARAAGLEQLDLRFHPSRVYDNSFFRIAGLDDGYHFLVRA
jgi:2-polyprenyl-3-methyl-5-hydroxy-6-metoxy-1,4-benzoquinol methylase